MSDPLGHQEAGSGPAALAQHFELALKTNTAVSCICIIVMSKHVGSWPRSKPRHATLCLLEQAKLGYLQVKKSDYKKQSFAF